MADDDKKGMVPPLKAARRADNAKQAADQKANPDTDESPLKPLADSISASVLSALSSAKGGLMSSPVADALTNGFGKSPALMPKDDLSTVGQAGASNPGPGPAERMQAAADALGMKATDLASMLASAVPSFKNNHQAYGAAQPDPTSPDILPGTRGDNQAPPAPAASLSVSTDRDVTNGTPAGSAPQGMMAPPASAAPSPQAPTPAPQTPTPPPGPSGTSPSPTPPPTGMMAPPSDPNAPSTPSGAPSGQAAPAAPVPVPGQKPNIPSSYAQSPSSTPSAPQQDMGSALAASDRSGQSDALAGAQGAQDTTQQMLKLMANPSVGGGPVEAFRVNGMNFKYVGVSDSTPSGYALDKGGSK